MKHILRRTLAVSISFAMGMTVVPAVYGDDISFNEDTMKDEIDYFVENLKEIVEIERK